LILEPAFAVDDNDADGALFRVDVAFVARDVTGDPTAPFLFSNAASVNVDDVIAWKQ
jgi:hypothetical protein